MISILEEELVNRKKWITSRDMLEMLVIAESTPGVIAVNTATSVGYRARGVLGAVIATIGVVLPSFLIITALSFFINAFAENTWYKAAFTGVQACVTILVVNAFFKMAKQLERGWFSALLVCGALGVLYTLLCDVVAKRKARKLPLQQNECLPEQDNERNDSDGGEVK